MRAATFGRFATHDGVELFYRHWPAAGSVLVCCALGYSRSATAVAGWLLQTGRAGGIGQAVETVTRARPRVVLGEEHRRALEALRP